MMLRQSGRDAKCHYLSDEWLQFTGATLSEALGDGWVQHVHPDDLDFCRETYLQHFKSRKPFEVSYRLRRHDRVFRTVRDHGVPLFAHDEFLGYLGASVEVERDEELDARRVELTSNVAHDLRQPLSTLMLLVDRMRRNLREGLSPNAAQLSQVRSQLDRCAVLVEDLADTAVVELGRPLALHTDGVDLTALLEELVELFNAREEARRDGPGHRFVLHGRTPLTLESADGRRLERVFVNLLENARKYSAPGVEALIQVRLRERDGYAEVEISDSGVGMKPETLAHLTQRFFRATVTRHVPGLGLGLSISRDIVEAHGGGMIFSSRLGEGTTVTVRLPIAVAPLHD